jgi:hypothetical protein
MTSALNPRFKIVGLIVLFSLGALGTALTVVRLWKAVTMMQLQRRRQPELTAFAALAAERMVLMLLSGLEAAFIPICANGPALAACWKTRGRRPVPPAVAGAAAAAAAAAAAQTLAVPGVSSRPSGAGGRLGTSTLFPSGPRCSADGRQQWADVATRVGQGAWRAAATHLLQALACALRAPRLLLHGRMSDWWRDSSSVSKRLGGRGRFRSRWGTALMRLCLLVGYGEAETTLLSLP